MCLKRKTCLTMWILYVAVLVLGMYVPCLTMWILYVAVLVLGMYVTCLTMWILYVAILVLGMYVTWVKILYNIRKLKYTYRANNFLTWQNLLNFLDGDYLIFHKSNPRNIWSFA